MTSTDEASLPESTFGTTLRDSLHNVNNHVIVGLSFLYEFRDFVKEKNQIEKEYSRNLEMLVKKHSVKLDKKTRDLSIGATPLLTESTAISSLMKAWMELLSKTECISKERLNHSEKLLTEISDKLKIIFYKKEEARKKHLQFATRVASDRDKIFLEKDKTKQAYYDACEAVESAKLRHERADEKTAEKTKKMWHEAIVEMNNAKNAYILANVAANSVKKSYNTSELPFILDELQDLEHRRIDNLKVILGDFVRLEQLTLKESLRHLELVENIIQKIQPKYDTELFIKSNKGDWIEQPEFTFEPTGLWRDSGEMVTDDFAKVVLQNSHAKLLKKRANASNEIAAKNREIEGIEKLLMTYSQNPRMGDFEEVKEQLLDSLRTLSFYQTAKARYESQITTIVSVIGDDSANQRQHTFKPTSFALPTTCGHCQAKIWGLSKQGMVCKDCGFTCHTKCEMKVAPNCASVRPISNSTADLTNNYVAESPSNRSSLKSDSSSAISRLKSGVYSRPGSEATIGECLINSASPQSESTHRLGPEPVEQKASHPKSNLIFATVIYDYNPDPDRTDELKVKAGEVVEVLEPDDGSGWCMATCNDHVGMIPATYVEFNASTVPTKPTQKITIANSNTKVRALYSYTAQTDIELSIMEGDVIEVTNRDCGDGWWEGKVNGKLGQFPANYVEEV